MMKTFLLSKRPLFYKFPTRKREKRGRIIGYRESTETVSIACGCEFRSSSCLALHGKRRGILGIRKARFQAAFVFLLYLVFQPSSKSSSALRLQFHILDISPFNFLH